MMSSGSAHADAWSWFGTANAKFRAGHFRYLSIIKNDFVAFFIKLI